MTGTTGTTGTERSERMEYTKIHECMDQEHKNIKKNCMLLTVLVLVVVNADCRRSQLPVLVVGCIVTNNTLLSTVTGLYVYKEDARVVVASKSDVESIHNSENSSPSFPSLKGPSVQKVWIGCCP